MPYTVSRPGAINGATADWAAQTALFLKIFSGEVLTSFARENIMLGLTTVRTISEGKSASFPCVGTVGALYHTPGTDIDGQVVNHNEKVINIDSLLISPVVVPSIDEAMNHYDYRSIYTTETGRALAYEVDKRLLQVAIIAARTATPNVTGGPVGKRLIDANCKTDAAVLKKNILLAAQSMDENNIPETDRHVVVLPAQWYLLVQDSGLQNTQLHGPVNIQTASIAPIGGFQIHKSNNLPKTSIATAVPGENNTYYSATSFANTGAIAFHKGAVGTVKLLDLATESEYSVRTQATLIVSKLAVGHGVLRPECAVEIATA